jgi:glutamine---fructose-6-phosphate transaminase (isomerizing)
MTSTLHAEISEQPASLRRLLAAEADHAAAIGREMAGRGIRFILIAARGTSDNAARYGQYLFGARNRLAVALATPSLFTLYDCPPRLDGALVLGISQSGQSPDIVTVVEEARRQGVPTVAITNDAGSPLAAAAGHCLELHAGPELSIAATKTYTSELAALALLSMGLAGEPLRSSPLEAMPALVEKALLSDGAAEAAAEQIASRSHCVALGRGFNYSTTFEVALKTKELAYVEAEPYSTADFRHGPIAMVDAGFPAVLVMVGEMVKKEVAELRDELARRQARLVVLGEDETLRRPADLWVPVPAGAPEWLSPITAIVPGQLLAYHLARARGIDPDQPRTLQKVTLTR